MGVDTGRLRVVETVESSESGRRRRRPTALAKDRAGVRSPGKSGARAQAHAEPPPVDAGEPEQRTPGAYIKHQRKRKGMSLDQLAAITKIPRTQIELLEADRYEQLPGMVFAKGFLRCCARALDLDPDTVLGLLYERERERLRARRREASVAAAAHPSRRKRSRGGSAQAWIAEALGRLPSARILMWLVVALLVALVVLAAFTLASGHAETSLIRS
jgi:transcriptional regulator with XRE-family HTH domain